MTKDEALRLALDALEYTTNLSKFLLKNEANIGPLLKAEQAITAIKAALEAKDEPVADHFDCGTYIGSHIGKEIRHSIGDDLPPQRKPLTDEEIEELWDSTSSYYNVCDFARAIEAAHGIKGEAK